MKTEKKILLFLLFLPPFLGELVSASAPPRVFFQPAMTVLLVFLYGCGALIIRELRVRWRLGWSVVFLAIAYGILEEGLTAKSFFNPHWYDLGMLSGYGMVGGTQWPWAFMVTFFHVTISTLIPIGMADLLWPEYRDVPLTRRRGFVLACVGLAVVVLWGFGTIGPAVEGSKSSFQPHPFLTAGSIAVILGMGGLAFWGRQKALTSFHVGLLPAVDFGCCGFLLQMGNLLVPNMLASGGVDAAWTIIIQIILFLVAAIFCMLQLYHPERSVRHAADFIFGSVAFFVFLTPIHEFGNTKNPDPTQGMTFVGVVVLWGLWAWRRTVLARNL